MACKLVSCVNYDENIVFCTATRFIAFESLGWQISKRANGFKWHGRKLAFFDVTPVQRAV